MVLPAARGSAVACAAVAAGASAAEAGGSCAGSAGPWLRLLPCCAATPVVRRCGEPPIGAFAVVTCTRAGAHTRNPRQAAVIPDNAARSSAAQRQQQGKSSRHSRGHACPRTNHPSPQPKPPHRTTRTQRMHA